MAQASTSRLGICQTCNTTPARYSCPACSFPSCSLACSTSHKTARDCTGIAPPVWSRPIQANEMNWGSLMRDQSYIAGVGRAIEEVGKQLVGDKLIPQGRRLGADETVRLDERSEKEDKMVREARNQGVELMLLPKGMSKRQKNGTRWDPKKRQLEWTVEVSFLPRPSTDRSAPSQPPSIVATYPVPSVNTLKSVINDAFSIRDKKGKGKAVDPEEATWRLAQKEWLESFKASEKAVEEVIEGQEDMEQTTEEPGTKDQGEEPVEDLSEDGEVPQTDEVEGAEPEAGGQQDEASIEPAQPDVAPPEEGEARSEAVAPASPARSPPSRVAPPADDDSPFVLLLSFHARPIYPDSAPDGTQTTPSPSKTPSRSVYQLQLTPSLTLREALAGSTLLENPCFEIWPRETFLRQKLLGKIKVVEQPAELRVRERTGVWERGRGRGRGSSRGGPSDRGTFNARGRGRGRGGGGSYEGRSHEGGHSNPRSEGRWDDRRSQDSGWGKRGNGDDRSGDTKRPRND